MASRPPWEARLPVTMRETRSRLLIATGARRGHRGEQPGRGEPVRHEGGVDLLKRQIESFIDALPLGSIPGTGSLTNLVGRLLRAGARFSGSFLIFRKMLSTLGDVVEQISPGITVEQVVVEYALARGFKNNCAPGARKTEFTNPLRASDVARIVLSAQSFLPRVWLQSWRSIARNVGILPRPGSPTGMEQH